MMMRKPNSNFPSSINRINRSRLNNWEQFYQSLNNLDFVLGSFNKKNKREESFRGVSSLKRHKSEHKYIKHDPFNQMVILKIQYLKAYT